MQEKKKYEGILIWNVPIDVTTKNLSSNYNGKDFHTPPGIWLKPLEANWHKKRLKQDPHVA